MPALSLRLPDELDHRLAEEAEREGLPRSEVARQAIADYLARRERERFMAALVAEAQVGYVDDGIRREALQLAEEGTTTSNESLDLVEGRNVTEPSREDDGRWWK